MGLVNMVADELMEILFTNIQCGPQQFFRLAAKIVATEAQTCPDYFGKPRKETPEYAFGSKPKSESSNLPLIIVLKAPWFAEISVTSARRCSIVSRCFTKFFGHNRFRNGLTQ